MPSTYSSLKFGAEFENLIDLPLTAPGFPSFFSRASELTHHVLNDELGPMVKGTPSNPTPSPREATLAISSELEQRAIGRAHAKRNSFGSKAISWAMIIFYTTIQTGFPKKSTQIKLCKIPIDTF